MSTVETSLEELVRRAVRAELEPWQRQLLEKLQAGAVLAHKAPRSIDQLLSVDQVAKACRAKPETVRGWCLSGRLVGRKAGHRWVVRREDLERFMVERAPARPGLSATGIVDELARKVRFGGRR